MKKKTKKVDPIRLIRACFRDIRRVIAIPGQTIYFVTDDGRVVSTVRKDPRLLAPKSSRLGIVAVRAGRRVSSVARLVLEAFGPGRRSRKFRAHHLNGNPRDNRIENLRWISDSDWKRDIAHPESRSRAATLDRRTAVVRIRSRYPDAEGLKRVDRHPTYFVDDGGRIYSVWGREARRLVFRATDAPITLRDPDGATRQTTWGSVVAKAFVGPRPSTGHYLVHLDGDPSNYHPSNLVWQKRCPVPNTPRFTPDEIRAIRFLKRQGESSARIGRAFGCSDASVDDIGRRRSYASVPDSSRDPLTGLPAALRGRIVAMTRIGAALDPDAHRLAAIAAIRKAFPKAGPLRPLAGFSDYFITERGDVYSTRRTKVQRLRIRDGVVGLSAAGRVEERSVEKLVRSTFHAATR
jgi:hypothetical protein